jgi:hypothetical protein
MEISNDININYPVSGSGKPNTDYYPTAMEVRVMTNLVCDSKRNKLTMEIRKQIYDLILKSANTGNYSVEISSIGETSNLFNLIEESNIIDELRQKGFKTKYIDYSSCGGKRVFMIKWDKAY